MVRLADVYVNKLKSGIDCALYSHRHLGFMVKIDIHLDTILRLVVVYHVADVLESKCLSLLRQAHLYQNRRL